MKSGEIIFTTNLEVMPPGTRSVFYFNANKEDTFVFIFLGVEPRDGSEPLDPTQILNELGLVQIQDGQYMFMEPKK